MKRLTHDQARFIQAGLDYYTAPTYPREFGAVPTQERPRKPLPEAMARRECKEHGKLAKVYPPMVARNAYRGPRGGVVSGASVEPDIYRAFVGGSLGK